MIGGGGTAVKFSYLKKDGKGKLYVSGGDVDYSIIQGEKKGKVTMGDGTADPEGSLLLTLNQVSALSLKGSSKKMADVLQVVSLTTGTCSIKAEKVKGGINGKGLPADDTTKLIPIPYKGVPVDLDAGTGSLVSTTG